MNLNITSLRGHAASVDRTVIFFVIGLNAMTSIFGCLASLIIAVTIIKSKTLRTAMNITLVNLALADVCVSVVNNTVRIVLYSGVTSSELCRVDLFFQTLCDCVKPAMLAATSFERYQSIAKPFENRGKLNRTIFTVLMSWVFAFGVGIVSLTLTVDGATLYPCCLTTTRDVAHFRELLITFPVGMVNLLLVGIFYYLMMRTLNEHGKNMAKKPKAFKNKVKPAATNKKVDAIKPVKNKLTKTDTGLMVPVNSDVVWKNEQYTELDRADSHDTPTVVTTIKSEAGPSLEKTKEETIVPVSVNDNAPNIADVVSMVTSSTKRFTVRETRKTLLRAMKEHNLIGNNKTSLSAPSERSNQKVDDSLSEQAKQRYSCETPTANGHGIGRPEPLAEYNTTEKRSDPGTSVFTRLAITLRERRRGSKIKDISKQTNPSNHVTTTEPNSNLNNRTLSKFTKFKTEQMDDKKLIPPTNVMKDNTFVETLLANNYFSKKENYGKKNQDDSGVTKTFRKQSKHCNEGKLDVLSSEHSSNNATLSHKSLNFKMIHSNHMQSSKAGPVTDSIEINVKDITASCDNEWSPVKRLQNVNTHKISRNFINPSVTIDRVNTGDNNSAANSIENDMKHTRDCEVYVPVIHKPNAINYIEAVGIDGTAHKCEEKHVSSFPDTNPSANSVSEGKHKSRLISGTIKNDEISADIDGDFNNIDEEKTCNDSHSSNSPKRDSENTHQNSQIKGLHYSRTHIESKHLPRYDTAGEATTQSNGSFSTTKLCETRTQKQFVVMQSVNMHMAKDDIPEENDERNTEINKVYDGNINAPQIMESYGISQHSQIPPAFLTTDEKQINDVEYSDSKETVAQIIGKEDSKVDEGSVSPKRKSISAYTNSADSIVPVIEKSNTGTEEGGNADGLEKPKNLEAKKDDNSVTKIKTSNRTSNKGGKNTAFVISKSEKAVEVNDDTVSVKRNMASIEAEGTLSVMRKSEKTEETADIDTICVMKKPKNTNESKDSAVSVRRKSNNSHKIDVVEMDGTVHKRVEVQGSVTGAVCVLNTSNRVQGRRKVEMRAAKRIAVLIGSFVLLWLPLPLSVIFVVCQDQITQSSVEMLMITGSISTMTTVVNPLLNLLLNKQIRSAAKSSVKRGFSTLRKR